MCCESTETLDLPRQVIEMLASYRRQLDDRPWDWGDEGGEEGLDFFRVMRFAELGPAILAEYPSTGDWAKALVSVIRRGVPEGVVLIGIDGGAGLRIETGPPRLAIADDGVAIEVVIDSDAATDLRVTVGGREVFLAAHGATVESVDLAADDPVFDVRLGN